MVKEGKKSKSRKEKEFVNIKEEKIRNKNEKGQKVKEDSTITESEVTKKTITR